MTDLPLTPEETRCAEWFSEQGWRLWKQHLTGWDEDGQEIDFEQLLIFRELPLPGEGGHYGYHMTISFDTVGWEERWPHWLELAEAGLARGMERFTGIERLA